MKYKFPHIFTKFDGRLTISRPSTPGGETVIRITARDEDSRVTIFEGEIDPGDFMVAITGLSDRPFKGKTNISGVAGKKRLDERASVIVSKDVAFSRTTAEKYIVENCQKPGWYVDSYLGSQSSISYNHADGTYTLHYRVFTYVDETEE